MNSADEPTLSRLLTAGLSFERYDEDAVLKQIVQVLEGKLPPSADVLGFYKEHAILSQVGDVRLYAPYGTTDRWVTDWAYNGGLDSTLTLSPGQRGVITRM